MTRPADNPITEDIIVPRPLLGAIAVHPNLESTQSGTILPNSGPGPGTARTRQNRRGARPLSMNDSETSTRQQHYRPRSRSMTEGLLLPIHSGDSTASLTGPSPICDSDKNFSQVPNAKPGNAAGTPRRSLSSRFTHRGQRASVYTLYDTAKIRGAALQRKYWVQAVFEYTAYATLLAFVYLALIGIPLWKGAVWWLYWVVRTKFAIEGGWAIVLGASSLYAFLPLLVSFEKNPDSISDSRTRGTDVDNTALIIPCYKSAKIVGPTLEAALAIFPAENIFVIANGNSASPLDDTEDVCDQYRVNHIWSPIGSKIIAQFVGCYAAKRFRNVLLIDDDCLLSPDFDLVSDRLTGRVKCIGYTLKSVGPDSSKGTCCQQAQDLEYKISGLQRAFAGKIGSTTFPHGAVSLWDREFLKRIFHEHPGFTVSEDWFFGDRCRRLGGRIIMCTSTFVETETPPAVFLGRGGSRGGFGEMTVGKQRFMRWNFFFVHSMYYNMTYIIWSWKLGWWEIGAKIFVWQEVYETFLYLLTPFILPMSFMARPLFSGAMLCITIGMYLLNVIIFNELHLRLKHSRVSLRIVLFYYTPYKLILALINTASCYWSIYKYGRYFAKRHPKVIEDEKAIEVVLRLEEQNDNDSVVTGPAGRLGRKLTITKVKGQRSLSPGAPTEGLTPIPVT